MRILVVDDQPNLLSVTAATLEAMGFDVLQAANAEEALGLLVEPDSVDVLFADVVMPGRSGVDLAHEARHRHHGIGVILTSGYTPADTLIPRNWQFVPKPYKVQDLLTAIRRAT